MQYAEAVLTSLSSEVVNSIQSNCSCLYPRKNLQEETLTPLCVDSEDEPFIQVTYRARLLSTAEHSAEELIGHIEARRRYSSEAVPLQINHTLSRLVLSSAESCPTRIEFGAALLCRVQTGAEEKQAHEGDMSTKTVVTALLAEFVSLTTLFLLVALATICFTKARKRW